MENREPIFHEGEAAIQKRLGIAERTQGLANMMFREYMPEQHRDFFESLPMIFVGYTDQENNVWASVLASEQGFVETPTDKQMKIKAKPFKGDPLNDVLTTEINSPSGSLRMGILGIELDTRRRNRMSAQVNSLSDEGMLLDVVLSFGNCPQYIQNRQIIPATRDEKHIQRVEVTAFDDNLTNFISNADTFFVASSTQDGSQTEADRSKGADVSHRGGRPGFIKVEDNQTLLIPDYLGNNFFNTLGNFTINPSAGLLFIDFETGDIITLTGQAEVLWDDSRQNGFKGAERLWKFTLTKGYVLKAAMPFSFEFQEWAPTTQMTGTWAESEALTKQLEESKRWQHWEVAKVVDESDTIRSFYFDTKSGIIPDFKAGQFITLKVFINGKHHQRTYSVSSAPLDQFIRISVKRDGLVSNWLHDNLQPKDVIEIKYPKGEFMLDEEPDKPVVLLSAGVGITPMVSMYRQVIKESIRTRKQRPIFMVNTFRQGKDQAFFEEVNKITAESNGTAKAYWLLTQPESKLKPGVDYSAQGRINKETLQAILPLGKYEFYLCGPDKFMQDVYDVLLELGVQDDDIKAEAFGPASLKRAKPLINADKPMEAAQEVADTAVVEFSESQVEQAWVKEDGNLLEFAEAHGLTPEYSCRSGVCGSCKVKLTGGKVTHGGVNSFPVEADEALLCCAMPASNNDGTPSKLTIAV